MFFYHCPQVLQTVTINSAGGDGPIQLLRDQVQTSTIRDYVAIRDLVNVSLLFLFLFLSFDELRLE
jgi:hypothetical protein